ncbi:MAG: V0D/AC39 family V-type ATPase subunit [Eubacteriales bacterium]|jgi:V/A-type H+-transporting ATPase subunit C
MITSILRYSGIAAKTRAMYGRRLRPQDFQALLQAKNVDEVAAYLKNHPGYHDTMVAFAQSSIHRSALESLLREELSQEYARLLGFLSGNQQDFMNFWVHKLEIDEILYYLRLIISQRQQDYQPHMLPTIARHSDIPLAELQKPHDFPQLVELLRPTRYYPLLQPFTRQPTLDYTHIELTLRSDYFRQLLRSCEKDLPPEDSKILTQLVGGQIDLSNFAHLIRSKRFFHQPDEHIYTNLLPLTHRIDSAMIRRMVTAPTWEEAYDLIYETPYAKFFRQYHFDYVEQYFYRYTQVCARRILCTRQTGICIPFAFLMFKQLEVRTLTQIIEGIRYGVPGQEIARNILGYKGGEE